MLDSLTVASLVDELSLRLLGGRIQNVLQLDPDSVGFEIYAEHQRQYLVASANSRNPRLHLSAIRLSADPDRVSPLLLLLRKYARGGQIVSIQQPPLERIVRVSIAKRFFTDKKRELEEETDETRDTGEIIYSDLIVEIMGRRSNIILVNENGRILDSIKRVTPEMSRVRPVLPGRQYEDPPPQVKLNPRHLLPTDLARVLGDGERGIDSATLVKTLSGFSPQMAREVVYRTLGNVDVDLHSPLSNAQFERLSAAIASILAPLETSCWDPVVYRNDENQVIAFAPIPFDHLSAESNEEHVGSISAAIELSIDIASEPSSVRHGQRRAHLVSEIDEGINRAAARLHSIEEEMGRAREVEHWRENGNAIYAHIYEIVTGQTSLAVEGREIELDPEISPSENAQRYFERYRKAQSATEHLPELEHEARAAISYLEQLRELARLSEGVDQIEAVRQEWLEYRQPQGDKRQAKQRAASRRKRPVALRTSCGDTIYVGHSGPENETVTFELGAPDDLWLHARGVPGAHVILRLSSEEKDDTVETAASLAAWYSAGRNSTSVEVDVTQRRYVRKIKGSGPGMVTYRNEETINVRPRSPSDLNLV